MEDELGNLGKIIESWKGENILWFRNYSLARLTTVRIGGRCPALAVVQDQESLQRLIIRLQNEGIRYYILGHGSKVLFSSNSFKGVIIKLGKGFSQITPTKEPFGLLVGASVSLPEFINYCAKNSFTGMEFTYGIPGTIGGACATNAGAFGRSLSDLVEKVFFINKKGEPKEIRIGDEMTRSQIFAYRSMKLEEGGIIIGCALKMKGKEKRGAILSRIRKYRKIRNETQPKGFSFGCCFKNPSLQSLGSAGKLIEEAGLKGFKFGGCYVSKKHANFLLNNGKATFEDFYQTLQIIKLKVEKKSGVILEEEVRIVRGGTN